MDKIPPSRKSQTRKPRKSARSSKPRRSIRPNESLLSDADSITYIGDILTGILRDCKNNLPRYTNADFERDSVKTLKRLKSEGVQFATATLPSFFDAILLHLESGKLVGYPGFKLKGKLPYPHYLSGLVAPIYSDSVSSTSVKHMEHLYQFCVAFKKLKGPYKESTLSDQLRDFVQTDIDLSNVDLSLECVRDIARDARKEITSILRGLNPYDPKQAEKWIPRPGPGSTNTPTKHAHRFRPVRWGAQLRTFDYNVWYRPPFSGHHTQPRYYHLDGRSCVARRKLLQSRPNYDVKDVGVMRSRFKFVFKTVGKARGICLEENEVQWLQQGLRRGLYDHLEKHPLTRGHVCFTDQTVNQSLALLASIDQSRTTVDMSTGSDRIARHGVSYLFGGNKPLLQAIEAVSTEEIEIPKVKGFKFLKYMPIKKIAPMGSAVCFPIMALTHYCLIRAIIKHSSLPRKCISNVWVYGDDIIIDREATQAVYDYLPLFGMKINESKSFKNSYFRESCGTHAYKGVDITPTRFKTLFHTSLNAKDLQGALRTEAHLYQRGFTETASVTRQQILSGLKKQKVYKLPFVHPESPVIGFYRSDGCATLHEFRKTHARRWMPEPEANKPYYQTWVYRGVLVFSDSFTEKTSIDEEEERYLRWLTQGGVWATKSYNEDISRFVKIKRENLLESQLGYRC